MEIDTLFDTHERHCKGMLEAIYETKPGYNKVYAIYQWCEKCSDIYIEVRSFIPRNKKECAGIIEYDGLLTREEIAKNAHKHKMLLGRREEIEILGLDEVKRREGKQRR